jgi:hypothetical protein
MATVDLSEYVDVAARIQEFRTKHPEGSLQPADLMEPYRVEVIGDQTFIVVVAAAYRHPEDPRPGVGMAYEQFPGRTQFTRGSELQNAETSAWGRAVVAALAADTRKGVASADDVRNRSAERDSPPAEADPPTLRSQIRVQGERLGLTVDEIAEDFSKRTNGKDIRHGTHLELKAHLAWLRKQQVPA